MKFISKIQQYLFIILGLFIPTSIAISNIIIALLVLSWLFQGKFRDKMDVIKNSKWMVAIFSLIVLYFLGMTWGNFHSNYLWQFQRLALLLVFPVFLTLDLEKKTLKYAVQIFLITAVTSALFAIFVNINLIPESIHLGIIGENDNSRHPAFITYNYHNVILSFATTIAFFILFEKKTKYPYIIMLFIIVFGISIFTEKGRAGQVIFNLSSMFYILYYARKSIFKLIIFMFILFSFQYMIYNFSSVFKDRLDIATSVITGEKPEGNINDRLVFISESLQRIFKRPLLGYGTGSFGQIFINEVKSDRQYFIHTTPHNQYLYVWFEIGILGLILLIAIFFYQIKELYNKKYGIHRILLPISFMFLMLVDSYFFIFILTIMYIYLFTIYSKY